MSKKERSTVFPLWRSNERHGREADADADAGDASKASKRQKRRVKGQVGN